jgi:hypothetical protein
MCKICDDYEKKISNSKETFKKITQELVNKIELTRERHIHLEELSLKILNDEVPFEDTFSEDVVQYDSEDT